MAKRKSLGADRTARETGRDAAVSGSKTKHTTPATPAQSAMAACDAERKLAAIQSARLTDQLEKCISFIGAGREIVKNRLEGVVACTCGVTTRIGALAGVIEVFTRGPQSGTCKATNEIRQIVRDLLRRSGS